MRTGSLLLFTTPALLLSSLCLGGPVINIPPSTLPNEAFFAANPGATVNVLSGETIFPGEVADPFGFNGATVNIETGASSGFFTVDHFVEDVTYNISGGKLLRCRLTGSVGSTTLNVNSGTAERGLWLLGNTTCVQSGGLVGLTAGGQPAIRVEDTASFSISAGTIDNFVLVIDSASFSMSGGTLEKALMIEDDASAVISGGSTGQDGRLRDIGSTLTVTGGTIGTAFVVEKGVVNMSAGSFGDNSGIINGAGVDPIFNMTGGALGSDFRAFDGTINISGGLVGDGFRLGTPTGDGSGVTLNLTVKSATLAGVPLMLTSTPTVIFDRGGVFLSCVMLDDSVVGLILNEVSVFGEDRIRAAATLTIALAEPCAADLAAPFDGVLNLQDVFAFLALFNAADPAADLAAPFG
ncbi:MAG: hypothetical protein JKY96_09235, partial [Phycisphaerales bacterium]|nr:hypothetical protein [Phycisphaerales bacterium]